MATHILIFTFQILIKEHSCFEAELLYDNCSTSFNLDQSWN